MLLFPAQKSQKSFLLKVVHELPSLFLPYLANSIVSVAM